MRPTRRQTKLRASLSRRLRSLSLLAQQHSARELFVRPTTAGHWQKARRTMGVCPSLPWIQSCKDWMMTHFFVEKTSFSRRQLLSSSSSKKPKQYYEIVLGRGQLFMRRMREPSKLDNTLGRVGRYVHMQPSCGTEWEHDKRDTTVEFVPYIRSGLLTLCSNNNFVRVDPWSSFWSQVALPAPFLLVSPVSFSSGEQLTASRLMELRFRQSLNSPLLERLDSSGTRLQSLRGGKILMVVRGSMITLQI